MGHVECFGDGESFVEAHDPPVVVVGGAAMEDVEFVADGDGCGGDSDHEGVPCFGGGGEVGLSVVGLAPV